VMGMNTWVPSEHHEAGFFTVLGLMLVVLIVMVAYFRRRRWL
jgi:LPXTG-motif cell wall-anchored protein